MRRTTRSDINRQICQLFLRKSQAQQPPLPSGPAQSGAAPLIAPLNPFEITQVDQPDFSFSIIKVSAKEGTQVFIPLADFPEPLRPFVQEAIEDFFSFAEIPRQQIPVHAVRTTPYNVADIVSFPSEENCLIVSQSLLTIWATIYQQLAETQPNEAGQTHINLPALQKSLSAMEHTFPQELVAFAVSRHPNIVIYNNKILHTIRADSIEESMLEAIRQYGYEFTQAKAREIWATAKHPNSLIFKNLRPALFKNDIALLTGTEGTQIVQARTRKDPRFIKVGYGIYGRSNDWGVWPQLAETLPKPIRPRLKAGEKRRFQRDPACYKAIWHVTSQSQANWSRPSKIHMAMLSESILWADREISQTCETNVPGIFDTQQAKNDDTQRHFAEYRINPEVLATWQAIKLRVLAVQPRDTSELHIIDRTIEEGGRAFTVNVMKGLAGNTFPAEWAHPILAKPTLSFKEIVERTRMPEPTVQKYFQTYNPHLLLVGGGLRSLYHYWVTDPKIIEHIPLPSTGPKVPGDKTPWAFICYWITTAREEFSDLWLGSSEVQRTMMQVGFLYQIAIVNRILGQDIFRPFIDVQGQGRNKSYRPNRAQLEQFLARVASLGIQRPFPDSTTCLEIRS